MSKLLILILLSMPSLLWANSGRILYVSGSVTVERAGKTYRAVKNAKLIQGDQIRTGQLGRLHIRMSDRTLISLKPRTQFKIQTYRFNDGRESSEQTSAQARSVAGEGTSNRSIFQLFKGGFRAVTGLIGKRNRQAFGVNTPVATIGIRGTSFVMDLSDDSADNQGVAKLAGLQLAAADIMPNASLTESPWPSLAQASGEPSLAQKLTLGVADGAIIVSNAKGSLVLENGEFGEVRSGQAPSRLLRSPADSEAETSLGDYDDALPNQNTGLFRVATRLVPPDKAGQTQPTTGEEFSTEDTEFVPRRDLAIASNLTDLAISQTTAENAIGLNTLGNVSGMITSAQRDEALVPVAAEIIEGDVENIGFDPDTQLRWGRWGEQSTIQLSFADQTTQTLTGAQANLHIIQSTVSNAVPQLPLTGSSQYALIGNTNPVSSSQSEGFLGSAQFTADFDQQTVSSSLSLSVDQQLWQASGQGRLGLPGATANTFAGLYDNVTVDQSRQGSGSFAGFFTEGGAAAGLSYRLNQGNTAVQGVAAFEAVSP